MATITIQVGQCGVQLGDAMLSSLATTDETLYPFFSTSPSNLHDNFVPTARAILVDTEPKVINKVVAAARDNFRYRPDCSLAISQGGAANNWARGYSSSSPSSDTMTSVIDKVRRHMESIDASGGSSSLHIIHSMAGGTGSGLGCAITESLRTEFSNKTLIMNTVVAPFHSGEVIVQNYNAVLTLAALQASSDLIVTYENETASRACTKLYRNKSPTITDLNTILATQLSSYLLPAYSSLDATVPGDTNDLIRHMSPHPQYKFANAKLLPMMPEDSIDFTRDTWSGGIVRRLNQMHLCGCDLECDISWREKQAMHTSISSLLVLRGAPLTQQDDVFKVDCSVFDNGNFAPFNPSPVAVRRSYKNFQRRYEKCGSMLTNGQAVLPLLDRVSRCKAKYDVGAYVHQYSEYGVGKEEFEQSFLAVDQVMNSYSRLSAS